MVDPPSQLDELMVMADWVELSVVTSMPAELDRASVGETLDAAGLMGMQDGGLPPGDLNWLDADTITPEDESDRYTEFLWGELQRRSVELGDSYPFIVDGDGLMMRVDDWRQVAAYVFLLLLDHGRHYSNVDVGMAPNSGHARLFEKVVEAAAPGLFRGISQRFGWPREPGWPTAIEDRLQRFADGLGLALEGNLAQKVTANDKDKGLDVVASLGLGAGGDGSAWLLFQCAVGENWTAKKGEPSLSEWRDLLCWRGFLVKGVAVPRRLEGLWDINRTSRKFEGALVLERERLINGAPDIRLEATVRAEIATWCESVMGTLPYVANVGT